MNKLLQDQEYLHNLEDGRPAKMRTHACMLLTQRQKELCYCFSELNIFSLTVFIAASTYPLYSCLWANIRK